MKLKDVDVESPLRYNVDAMRDTKHLEKHSNKVFLNEINTIPGFTSKSMFPMLWKASGLNIDQLVAKLVDISLDL